MSNIHMIGIGGIGMSAIAQLLLLRGDAISGCDTKLNNLTEKLTKMGARIFEKHNPAHIDNNTDLIVYSSAVKSEEPELKKAVKNSIPIMRRAEILADILKEKSVIAVTGTHGKTTTSFMISHIMDCAGFDQGFAIGGEIEKLGGNARWGKSKYFVTETDESDGTHVFMKPEIAVITNIDSDHMEYYSGISHISKLMQEFVGKIPDKGLVVGYGEDNEVKNIIKKIKTQNIMYGFKKDDDIYATDIKFDDWGSQFKIFQNDSELGSVKLNIPGRHNILNALASIAVCMHLGVQFDKIKDALSSYAGVKRRLDIIIKNEDITIVDDYAHHPTEIKAVIDAVKKMAHNRLIGVFQPHRFTRTKLLSKQFARCFEGLDKLFLTDIYSAGETKIEGVTGKLIYNEVVKFGKPEIVYIEQKNNIIDNLLRELKHGDTVVFMGAGDITELSYRLKELVPTYE